jgi:hypothetical protein
LQVMRDHQSIISSRNYHRGSRDGGGALRLHTQAMSPELTFSEYSFCLQIIVAIAFLSYI